MSLKNFCDSSSSRHFNEDKKFAARASRVVTPWYNLLASTPLFIPPKPLDKKRIKQEKKALQEMRDAWSTLELRSKWRGSSAGKKYTWTRCDDATDVAGLQRNDIDVVAYVSALNRYVYVEEKFCKYINCSGSFLFETESCSNRGMETKGWASYSLAEWMLFGYWDEDRREMACKILNFHLLRPWAWGELNRVGRMANVEKSLGWQRHRFKQSNHSIAYKIPFADLPSGILLKEFTLSAPPGLKLF